MKTNLFSARHHAKVGPGGWFCACCGPAPKDRKKVARNHKKKMYRFLDQFEKKINDDGLTK